MGDCCAPGDFDAIFSEGQARADARAYRKHGLDSEAKGILAAIRRRADIDGATVLEVGGGIGAIQIELLRAGASHTTNVELSPGYEPEARRLIAEAGLDGRVDRHIADFVADEAAAPVADAVVLQRVICCYPDAARLVSAAARHARRTLVLTLPIDRWWTGPIGGLINLWPRIRRSKFRFFVHPTRVVIAAAEREGLDLAERRGGVMWQRLVFVRGATG